MRAAEAGTQSAPEGHTASAMPVASLHCRGENCRIASTMGLPGASTPKSLCQNSPTLQKKIQRKRYSWFTISTFWVEVSVKYCSKIEKEPKIWQQGLNVKPDVSCVTISGCCKLTHYLWFGSIFIYLESFSLRVSRMPLKTIVLAEVELSDGT